MGFLSDAGGGSSTTTNVQSNEPPDFAKPYLEQLYGMAGGLADTPSEFPPFSTTVGFAPESEAAYQGFADRAAYGSPVVGAAGTQLTDTLGGGYLGGSPVASPVFSDVASGALSGGDRAAEQMLQATRRGDYYNNNPELDRIIERTLQDIMPSVNSTFSSAGRYGSGLHAKALTESLADAASGIRYQNYGQERQNQLGAANTLINQGNIGVNNRLGAAGLAQSAFDAERGRMVGAVGAAPAIAGEDYRDLTALLGVGEARQGLEQRLTDEQIQRYTFPQTEPWERARMFAELISPGLRYGTSSATETGSAKNTQNPINTLAGIGLAVGSFI